MLPQSLTQTGRREITYLLRSYDLTACAVTCPLRRGLDDAADLEPRLEQIRQTMGLAVDLGPRLVMLQAGRIPDKGELARIALMKDSLDALGRHGDRIGVTIALDTGLDSPETLAAYLDGFDTGSLAVNFNPANLVISGNNPYAAVKTLHRRIAQVHAQDARRISPNKMATVPLGHGDLDWVALVARFEEIDYHRYFTIPAEGLAELASGTAFLRRFLA